MLSTFENFVCDTAVPVLQIRQLIALQANTFYYILTNNWHYKNDTHKICYR